MHGSGPDGPVDLPITLTTDPFTFGPIREGTAQIAPPVDGSRSGAGGVASTPPVEPAAPVVAPAAAPAVDPATAPAAPALPDSLPGWVVPVLVALGVALAVAALAALVARGRRRPDDRDRIPGATGAAEPSSGVRRQGLILPKRVALPSRAPRVLVRQSQLTTVIRRLPQRR